MARQCEWCQSNSSSSTFNVCATHALCHKCQMNEEESCKSYCPSCCYENVSNFLREKQICSVCHMKPSTKLTEICPRKHAYCSECLQDGCVLCAFFHGRSQSINPLHSLHDRKDIFKKVTTWKKILEQQSSYLPENAKYLHLQEPPQMPNHLDQSRAQDDTSGKNPSTDEIQCIICLENIDATDDETVSLACDHRFHEACIKNWYRSSGKQACPTCGRVFKTGKGPQPPNGRMEVKYISNQLPGFSPNESDVNKTYPTIEIKYIIPSGKQGPLNPNPGQPYLGTTRIAYLPNNPEGEKILTLLQRAFNDQHLFTIGTSTTSGAQGVVTWNDIHHKTSISGGPSNYGYPDSTYLARVRHELAAKGYT